MFCINMRCVSCKSTELVEEYEGAELTCTKCGTVGCVETIPSIYSLETLEESLETEEERRHREIEAFAAKMLLNIDVSDLLGGLTLVQRRRRARRLQDPMLVDTQTFVQVHLKMNNRRFRVPRYRPY